MRMKKKVDLIEQTIELFEALFGHVASLNHHAEGICIHLGQGDVR